MKTGPITKQAKDSSSKRLSRLIAKYWNVSASGKTQQDNIYRKLLVLRHYQQSKILRIDLRKLNYLKLEYLKIL